MTPAEYELLLADIVRGIQQCYSDLSSLKLGTGRKNHIKGASGYNHQIDVSFLDLHRLFIIECKRWNKRIGVAEILILASRAIDVQQLSSSLMVSPILACTKGASSNAQRLADHFNISIEIVKSAHEFGLRLGKRIYQATCDEMGICEKLGCTTIRNGQVIGDLPPA